MIWLFNDDFSQFQVTTELHSYDIPMYWIELNIHVQRNISYLFHMGGLVQERRNSSALAMELSLSCINPSTYYAIDFIILPLNL